jgi:uncharacterized protein (TIGR02246 family)
MRWTLPLISVVLVARPAWAQGHSGDEASIRANVAAYEAAINKRDGAAVSALFAPDGDYIFFDGPRVVGRDAIKQSNEHGISSWPSTMHFTLEVTDIRFLRPDLAIVETLAHFSEGDMRSNRGTAVVIRRNGKWLIAALRVFPAQGT